MAKKFYYRRKLAKNQFTKQVYCEWDLYSSRLLQPQGKSAIAAADEFELTFTNVEVHNIVRISKTDQDYPNLLNASETKHQLGFYITSTTEFLFLISDNDSINLLSVSTNMNYLENGLDSINKSSA